MLQGAPLSATKEEVFSMVLHVIVVRQLGGLRCVQMELLKDETAIPYSPGTSYLPIHRKQAILHQPSMITLNTRLLSQWEQNPRCNAKGNSGNCLLIKWAVIAVCLSTTICISSVVLTGIVEQDNIKQTAVIAYFSRQPLPLVAFAPQISGICIIAIENIIAIVWYLYLKKYSK